MRGEDAAGLRPSSWAVIASGLGFAVAGCVAPSEEAPLPLELPQAFSDSGSSSMPDQWWTVFNDAALNRLVTEALESNFDLLSAWQRLRQAQAVADRTAAGMWPSVFADAEAELSRPELENRGDRFGLGLAAEYEVDLWGSVRSSADAERYRARATFADYQTAAITLAAEVTRTWYQLAAARNQRDLLVAQIDTNQQVLELIEANFGTGQIRSVDVLRQRQLMESTREQLIETESRIQVLNHSLSALLGQTPQRDLDTPQTNLPTLPPLPRAGLPADLVRRRPDIRRAHNSLLAADRELAAAIADRYPSLTLSASIMTEGESAEDLFQEWIRSVGGNLLAPLFLGGALDAEIDRTEAARQELLYEYGQTTLNAFHEVENALVQEKKQAERIASLERQIRLSSQSYEQLRNEYFNGVADYIEVLTALTEDQQLRRDLLEAKMALIEFRIALYRSLAGGFETEREVTSQGEPQPRNF